MKTAVIQCPDTGPLESLVIMLRAAGYRCLLTSPSLLSKLKDAGCDVVIPGGIADLVRGMGYEHAFPSDAGALGVAGLKELLSCNLYADIKAHKNYDKLVQHWPRLEGRVLWYRINGGKPEHVIKKNGEDCGDEVNPPCPILTPNQWYLLPKQEADWSLASSAALETAYEKAYCCWPPFYRFDEYYPRRGRPSPLKSNPEKADYSSPICLIHNLKGWGYERLVAPMRAYGVKCYGVGSPDGLIKHSEIPDMLGKALCMVHLKSSDAPGYALYEAMAAGCPVICTRRLIWRCRMESLFVPGETCLVFDRETHEGLTDQDVSACLREVRHALFQLADPAENQRIGMNGRNRLRQIMWNEAEDVPNLRAWLRRMFP